MISIRMANAISKLTYLNGNILSMIQISLQFLYKEPNWQPSGPDSDNGLMLIRRQAFIWTKYGLYLWRLHELIEWFGVRLSRCPKRVSVCMVLSGYYVSTRDDCNRIDLSQLYEKLSTTNVLTWCRITSHQCDDYKATIIKYTSELYNKPVVFNSNRNQIILQLQLLTMNSRVPSVK